MVGVHHSWRDRFALLDGRAGEVDPVGDPVWPSGHEGTDGAAQPAHLGADGHLMLVVAEEETAQRSGRQPLGTGARDQAQDRRVPRRELRSPPIPVRAGDLEHGFRSRGCQVRPQGGAAPVRAHEPALAEPFGQAATQAPQPMQVAAANAWSASSFGTGRLLASGAEPVLTLM